MTSANSLAGLYHCGHIVGSRFAPLEKFQNSSRGASKDGGWRNLRLTLYGEKTLGFFLLISGVEQVWTVTATLASAVGCEKLPSWQFGDQR